jgi:protein TonB
MEINKILTADLLDLVFDDRNKEYGAYDLRKTYQQRITKAMIITGSIAVLVFGGSVMASSFKSSDKDQIFETEVTLTKIPDDPLPEVIPPVEKPPEVQPARTEIFVTPDIVEDNRVVEPPPDQSALENAQIDKFKQDGPDDSGIEAGPKTPDAGTGIIAKKVEEDEPDIWVNVQVEAKFTGNWENFLRKNLNPEVPVNNDAPTGRYSVTVLFVVDVDGTVSDIKPISNVGFGMEQEAVRVLKKAAKWEPAFQNGKHVKAYRKQVIVFEVVEE